MSERWYMEHMGIMAFWRTVLGVVNVILASLVTLKVFGLI